MCLKSTTNVSFPQHPKPSLFTDLPNSTEGISVSLFQDKNHGIILDASFLLFFSYRIFNPSPNCIDKISKIAWETKHLKSPSHHPSWVGLLDHYNSLFTGLPDSLSPFSLFSIQKPESYMETHQISQFSSVQSFSRVWLFAAPRTAVHQASLSITNSRSLPKLMSIKSVMPSNHLILCHLLLLSPSILTSIRVFSSEPALHIRWQKYWSFRSLNSAQIPSVAPHSTYKSTSPK